jgi:hypothetical protein
MVGVRDSLWNQFGAAIDMLENAVRACPDALWGDRAKQPEYWYLVFHTLFFLDFYLEDSAESFRPPPPFTLDELDPAGVLPDRVYRKDELLAYLDHGRRKCRGLIDALTEESARRRRSFQSIEGSVVEVLLYSLRHVQHHTAQLNLILRRETDSAPRWVSKARDPLAGR